MRHVDLTAEQVALWMARPQPSLVGDQLEVFALAARFPNVPIDPNSSASATRYAMHLQLDSLADAVITRYLSIDLQRNKATLFYDDNFAWCFQHRCYMTADDTWQTADGVEHAGQHYEVHGLTEQQYLNNVFTPSREAVGVINI